MLPDNMKKVVVIYDNWCPNCSRFMRLIKKIDWLQLVVFQELRNELELKPYESLDSELAKQQMASFIKKWEYGYVSLYYIFKRIPLLWVAFPFFYFLKATGLGQYLYVQLALKRKIIPLHCDANSCSI